MEGEIEQMGSTTTPTTSRSRLLPLRIFGWLLGVGTIGFSLLFVVGSLLTDDPIERSHRFHYLAGLAGGGLIGLFSILWVMRPERTAFFHVLVAQSLAWLIGGLMGGDLVTGFYISGVIGLLILAALYPARRSLLRLPGRPSVAMLTYTLIAAFPAWIYAVTYAELQHGPASDPHVQMHHWSGVAVAAVAIVAAGIASSLRGEGWRVASAATAGAAALFGVAGLIFSETPGAPDQAWSWIAIAAGIGFWLLSGIQASWESTRA